MWHALRAELAYFRPWLLGGLGIAAGVSLMMLAIKFFVDDAEGIPGFLTSMFLFIAGMVVSFIVGRNGGPGCSWRAPSRPANWRE